MPRAGVRSRGFSPSRVSAVARASLAGAVAAAALLAATLACAGPAAAASGKGARCSFAAGSRVLEVTIERDPAAGTHKGTAYIGSRHGFLRVLGGTDGDPIDCSGPSPTTRNIESIHIVGTAGLGPALVYIDQRGGAFAPGNTAEADGSSEIEFDIDLGDDGVAFFFMTTADDAVYVRDLEGTDYANLNAFEAAPDTDVIARNGTTLFVDGAGGDDLLSAAPVPAGPYDPSPPLGGFGVGLFGGAGDDALFGTQQRDVLVGGGGEDFLGGAGGKDFLLSRDRRHDDVDCGPGRDATAADSHDALVGCERRELDSARARPTDHLPLRLRHR
jgi:Ca2+-binding RTX toxin-like protein